VLADKLTAVTLVPALAECRPSLAASRDRLGVPEALLALRSAAATHLVSMAAPVGFRARARKRDGGPEATPHEAGPDPPTQGR
jgi:hypothetical protein